jgi:hypothetical protein
MRSRRIRIRDHDKLTVASQQLDTALRLYFGRREYFSAITLAGAAEEILGVYLKLHKQPNAFGNDLDASLRVYRWLHGAEGSPKQLHKTINRVKNSTKHMAGRSDRTLTCDAREEARDILDRAVTNYYRLMSLEPLTETPRIRKFNAYLVGRNA